MNEITTSEQLDLQTAALKVPPHSIEAEQAVLGGLMLDNDAWERVLDQVSDGDFYRHDHRLIFRAVHKLADANQPFDVVTLHEQLDKEGLSSQVGGLAYLAELAKNTPSVANIDRKSVAPSWKKQQLTVNRRLKAALPNWPSWK